MTVLAILTLAIGIGANAAIFSVIYSVMIEPLPYPHADRVVLCGGRTAAVGHRHLRGDQLLGGDAHA